MISGARSVTHPALTMAPAGKASTSWENLSQLRKAALGSPLPGREGGVGRHHPGEAVRVFGHQAQADEASPVLAHQRDPVQVQDVEEERAHPFDMAGVGVLGARRRFVRSAEPDQIGSHHPQSGADQNGNHVTVEVGPRGLAVHEQNALGCGRTFLQVVDPEDSVVLIGDVGVVGSERIPGQVVEAVVGGAEDLHRVTSPLVDGNGVQAGGGCAPT